MIVVVKVPSRDVLSRQGLSDVSFGPLGGVFIVAYESETQGLCLAETSSATFKMLEKTPATRLTHIARDKFEDTER